MNPIFLGLDDVLAIHASRIVRYGGSAGIRDAGLLESAIAMPASTFGDEWLHSTLSEMAAAYLFHICKNHPFVDGNKRTALAVAIAFLGMNDLAVTAEPEPLTELVLSVAEGKASKAQIAVFFEGNTAPRRSWT